MPPLKITPKYERCAMAYYNQATVGRVGQAGCVDIFIAWYEFIIFIVRDIAYIERTWMNENDLATFIAIHVTTKSVIYRIWGQCGSTVGQSQCDTFIFNMDKRIIVVARSSVERAWRPLYFTDSLFSFFLLPHILRRRKTEIPETFAYDVA